MQLKNTNEIQKIAKEIKPIMDLEIGWGNEILNTLIAVALDKYKKNVDANASFKELLLFVGIDGFLKIYAPIKPKAGVMNDRDHLYSNEVSWHEDYEYFVNALYNKFLEFNNIVKKVCTELGITQKELAEKINRIKVAEKLIELSSVHKDDIKKFREVVSEHLEDIKSEKDVRTIMVGEAIPSSNIIKKTCKELGLTYAQLAEQIGYSEPAIKKAIANETVSEPMQKAILLYLKTLELEKQLEDYTILKSAIKKAIN